MKEDNLIRDKSFAFAIRIVKVYKYLTSEKSEFVLSKQLLRSGTSIGANVEEALGAHSTKDFVAKLSISYKETREAIYWIRLLRATDYLSEKEAKSLLSDANSICRILSKIQLTVKAKSNNP